MQTTHAEYMRFFTNWLHYQFDRADDEILNVRILRQVSKIVADADELAHWANRDCWSMYELAKASLANRAIKGTTHV